MSSSSVNSGFSFDIPESFEEQGCYRVLYVHQGTAGALEILSRCYNNQPDLSDILILRETDTPETNSRSWRDIKTSYADYIVIYTKEQIGLSEIREIRRGLNTNGLVVFTKTPPEIENVSKLFISNGFKSVGPAHATIIIFKMTQIACCGNIR
ncbi:MAG: hypothetical protein AB7W47_10250 [Calditrichaceae bacterium]